MNNDVTQSEFGTLINNNWDDQTQFSMAQDFTNINTPRASIKPTEIDNQSQFTKRTNANLDDNQSKFTKRPNANWFNLGDKNTIIKINQPQYIEEPPANKENEKVNQKFT